MTIASPLARDVILTLGPVPVTRPILTSWAIIAVLAGCCWLVTRHMEQRPSRPQALLELLVDTMRRQVGDTVEAPAGPYLPLIGTIFLFILAANWSSLVPGVEPPTATLETDAALALVVFGATLWFVIRARGAAGYLRSFASPSIVLAPLNLIELFTRSFALTIRLFGNVMGGVFMIGVVLSLAGLLVPIPLMALEVLTGAVQAYIFAALAAVFIGSAIGEAGSPQEEKQS